MKVIISFTLYNQLISNERHGIIFKYSNCHSHFLGMHTILYMGA